MEQTEEALTPTELAQKLKVQKSWVYSKTRTGEIPFFKAGKYLRFHFSSVLATLEKRSREQD